MFGNVVYLSIFYFVSALFPFNAYSGSLSPITESSVDRDAVKFPEMKGLSRIRKTGVSPVVQQPALIVLDPGHGGHDVGTQSISKPRYQEKSLNLVTARFVKTYLLQMGYRVYMTRDDDVFVSLEKRAQTANGKKPELFVSIHYNSAPTNAQGVEVFFFLSTENKKRTGKSKRLAQSVLKNVIAHTKAKSRGVKQGNYAVIRETAMPAVLIEGGFVTNEEELEKLKDPVYLKRLAWGIARGIQDYLTVNENFTGENAGKGKEK